MTQVAVRYQMTRVATAAGNKAHWSAPDGRYFATKTACGRPVAYVALTAHLKNGMCLACATIMGRVIEEAHAEAIAEGYHPTATPMLQALIVARIAGTVRLDDSWVGTPDAVVSSVTLSALQTLGMIALTAEDGVFELTIKGYRALAAAGIITDAMLQAEINDLADVVEEAHAEAIVLDEKRTTVRAALSIPTGVELSWGLIEQAFEAYLTGREADVCSRSWVAEIELCPQCGRSAAEHAPASTGGRLAPKVGQRYRRADGDVVELKAVFPLDQSIAFLIVEAPNHTYRRGLRGTVSFSGLAEHYELVPSAAPNALYWAGRKFLVLGTVGYQHGRAVCLIEDDGRPAVENGVDFSFCIRETDLRHGSWSARP